MSHGRRRISYKSSKLMGFRSPMYTVFLIVGVVPPWAPPGYYSPLIPLIPLLTCIWALQSWMSDILFPRPRRCFRCQIFGHSILTCRRQATCSHCGKLPHRPCLNPSSCVNCGGPHPSDFPNCSSYIFEKTALEILATEKLTSHFRIYIS